MSTRTYVKALQPGDVFTVDGHSTRYRTVRVSTGTGSTVVEYRPPTGLGVWQFHKPAMAMVTVHTD